MDGCMSSNLAKFYFVANCAVWTFWLAWIQPLPSACQLILLQIPLQLHGWHRVSNSSIWVRATKGGKMYWFPPPFPVDLYPYHSQKQTSSHSPSEQHSTWLIVVDWGLHKAMRPVFCWISNLLSCRQFSVGEVCWGLLSWLPQPWRQSSSFPTCGEICSF